MSIWQFSLYSISTKRQTRFQRNNVLVHRYSLEYRHRPDRHPCQCPSHFHLNPATHTSPTPSPPPHPTATADRLTSSRPQLSAVNNKAERVAGCSVDLAGRTLRHGSVAELSSTTTTDGPAQRGTLVPPRTHRDGWVWLGVHARNWHVFSRRWQWCGVPGCCGFDRLIAGRRQCKITNTCRSGVSVSSIPMLRSKLRTYNGAADNYMEWHIYKIAHIFSRRDFKNVKGMSMCYSW